ncbi:retrovirus-related Pol polyprotein from transposon 17.6 [Trichonephila clavipes]|nr:retrovirus-related Pol polyprotein from transposon 17.6 [Trichonephila clavipes]
MRVLASVAFLNDDFLKTLWLQQLPSEMQSILSVSSQTLQNLAKLADKIAEVRTDHFPNVSVMDKSTSSNSALPKNPREDLPNPLYQEVVALRQQVDALSQQFQRFSGWKCRNRSRTRSNFSRNTTRSLEREGSSEICYYHSKFANATLLVHPNPNANLVLQVDASDFAIGGALFQTEGEHLQPLAFFSRKLSETEKGYSAYDRELLAAYASIKQFRYMLEARNFILCTDHRPLTYAFKQKMDKCSPRQGRQLDFISQFTTDIRHIKGSNNLIADTLSIIASIHMSNPIDYNEIAKAQENDSELISLINNPQG